MAHLALSIPHSECHYLLSIVKYRFTIEIFMCVANLSIVGPLIICSYVTQVCVTKERLTPPPPFHLVQFTLACLAPDIYSAHRV